MTKLASPHGRRALIIEDEFLIALDLEETMFKLGFDVCALAPSARKARSLAMNDHPDVALVDVCLEGGREGIEIARRTVAKYRESLNIPSSIQRRRMAQSEAR